MRTARVTSPSGSEWEVRAFRVRLPPWRSLHFGEGLDEPGDTDMVLVALNLLVLPFTVLLIPLLIAIAELPLVVARALTSKTAWVEAVTRWPAEERFVWRTTRADAPGVRAAVAAQLSAGVGMPRPPRAELVERPPKL